MIYERKYAWKKHHGVKAEIAGKTMEKIEDRDGAVTKEALLEEARPEDSPMHPAFEWDDGVAAEKYRLEQARYIIADIVVMVEKVGDDDEMKSIPAYVNVVAGKNNPAGYRRIDVAMHDEVMRDAVLQNALAELKQFRKKYATLKELDGVFNEIKKLEKEAS